MLNHITTRRRLLTGSGALTAGALTGEAAAAQRKKFRRRSPSSVELMEIGVLVATPGMTHIDSLWGPLINPPGEPWTRLTGMVMTRVWDKDPKVAANFARKYGCRVVKNYADMAGKVDGVILSDFLSAHYFYELARPYLEAGSPIFINRPFAYSMRKAKMIVELSQKTGTPIMCGDTHEYVKEVNIVRAKVKEMEPLIGVQATNSMSDYPSHGIHGLYWLHACLGGGVQVVSYITPDWRRPHGVCILEYAPRIKDGKVFYASLHQNVPTGTNASIKLYTQGSRYFKLDFMWEKGDWDRLVFMFLQPVLAMQKMFETGKMPESHESLLEKTGIFLTGFYSAVEKGGAPVRIADLPEDWTAPGPGEDWGKGVFSA
jgi:predicted dehydrogenase